MANIPGHTLHVGHMCPICGPNSFITSIDFTYNKWACGRTTRHTFSQLPQLSMNNILPAAVPSVFGPPTNKQAIPAIPYIREYRGTFNVDDTKPIKRIDEYPSTCPRCQSKCYLGLSDVKHKDTSLDNTCR